MSRPQVTTVFTASANTTGEWLGHIAMGKCSLRVSGDFNGILYVDSAINPDGSRTDVPQDASGIPITQISGPKVVAVNLGAGSNIRFRLANNTSGSVTAVICQGE